MPICPVTQTPGHVYPEKLSSQVGLFADDTAVYLTVGGSDDGTVLQKDLDKLSAWESQWEMEFNPSKCQVVRVTTARRAINSVYILHGQILEVITSAKYSSRSWGMGIVALFICSHEQTQ